MINSSLKILSEVTARIWDNPFPGMLMFMDGAGVNEGRVEVYCNGV